MTNVRIIGNAAALSTVTGTGKYVFITQSKPLQTVAGLVAPTV